MNERAAIELLQNTIRRKHFSLSTEQTYTTMGYLHAEALSVRSPLELLA